MTFIRVPGAAGYSPVDQLFAETLAARPRSDSSWKRPRTTAKEMMLVGDRERIGRDPHDHVIQRLFATGMTQGALAPIDRPKAQQKVSDAIDSLDATVREIRNTIFSLSMAATGDSLLRAQVMEEVADKSDIARIRAVARIRGPRRYRGPRADPCDVLAVVREALSNIARMRTKARLECTSPSPETPLSSSSPTTASASRRLLAQVALPISKNAPVSLGGAFRLAPNPEGSGTCLEWQVPIGN